MKLHSILFGEMADSRITETETAEVPDFFSDLILDQIIDAITADKQEYHLKPFFYTPLHDINLIRYRYEVMQDLADRNLFDCIKAFTSKMSCMREQLVQADKLHYKYQKESWFLAAVEVYCEAVGCLVHDLSLVELKSRGFLAFRDYITEYYQSQIFTALLTETKQSKTDLSLVQYCMLIQDNCIQVRKYAAETDYSAAVEKTFEKFRQGAGKNYQIQFSDYPEMNHVEEQILDFVAKLYPEIFSRFDNYCIVHDNYLDETLKIFDREIQFYIAYLEFIERFEQNGLKFCYPQVSSTGKEVCAYESFDLALANKLIGEKVRVVCNDFYLKGNERIFVVSGPNQGGKTTFARTFGQLHYLAGIGCPVPGRKAQLFLFDKLFTHFEKAENIKNLRGKLQDDLVRIYDILNQATADSIIIMNEIFTSTTLKDAGFLGKQIMKRIVQLDALCVCVTFIDELTACSENIVSLVSTVVPENPALRTYKIVRKSAGGRLYAVSLAEKYRLTYECLKERIQ
ncbi:MAG: hypothetical protein ABFC84_08170 [Veillonellales bacterium]